MLRGAHTISSYLEGTGTNLRLPLTPPFNEEFEANYDTLTLPASRTEQGLTPISTSADPFAGATIRLWDPNVKPAFSQQYNLTVQTEFSPSTTGQVGYVGQKGTHLMVPMRYGQRKLISPGVTAPSPYLSGNPALKSISRISGTESNGKMEYNSLQAVLQRRFSGGLQAQVAYAYSKCMTNNIGYYGGWGQAASASAYWQNLYDSKAEWGPRFFDVTHMLTSYAVYDVPIGRHRAYGKGMNPVLNGIIGDWNLSGILQLHGGYPLTIGAGDASGTVASR